MARKVRLFVEDIPQHIIIKSIDNLTIFKELVDYEIFLKIVEEVANNNNLKIHAYVVMPTYFEFLATPADMNSLPRFMQSLSRNYVGYFNKKYSRSGTLWNGRYKSSIVESEEYLLGVMRYIEYLPVTEQLVSNIEKYKYSSIHKNLFNQKDNIVCFHKIYKDFAFKDKERLEKYRSIIYEKDDKQDNFIKVCLVKQLITGTKKFISNLEEMVGMTLNSRSRGRPKKEITNKGKKMYKNLVVLDKEKHKEIKINPLENLVFAKSNSFIPIVANEISLVGSSFPVVFTSGENTSLVSLVSLGGDSLAINEDGKWLTSYVPSFLRKYPFSMAATKENPEQKVILIDEDSSLFSKSKGKKLFKKDGEQSDTLTHAVNFLTTHENQSIITSNIAKIISDSGILEDREISIGEGEEKKVLVNGFKVVDREKLNLLSDDVLADWVRRGIISMIDAHLKSLDNIQTLFNLAHKRQS